MGQSLQAVIEQRSEFVLQGIWKRGDDLASLLAGSDVLIDFSLPEASGDVIAAARKAKIALVCGVSGLGDAEMDLLAAASHEIPIVYDRNMSMGIAVLQQCLSQAAAALGDDFDVNILDVHHVHKIDAPSGTALQLGETIAAARGRSDTSDVSFQSERRGEIPGEHRITMTSESEVLEFSHSVSSRQVFTEGALRAAAWVFEQPAGLFSIQDVLFKQKKCTLSLARTVALK